MQIFTEGNEKFTHYTARYVIKIIDMRNGASWKLIERADIFHARKSAIEICSVLKLKVDKRIYWYFMQFFQSKIFYDFGSGYGKLEILNK